MTFDETGQPERGEFDDDDEFTVIEISVDMRLALAPLLWCQRELGPSATLGAAVRGECQLLITSGQVDDPRLRLLERVGDLGEWRIVDHYDNFADALEALAEQIDDVPTVLPIAEGTAVLALPADDGLIGAVHFEEGFVRAFEAWSHPGDVLFEGDPQPTVTAAMQWDIAVSFLNG